MQLNPAQQVTADHKGGPLLVIAPPGSGKTASISQRAINLICAGLPPKKLLLVTFSVKAADEMRDRIGTKLEKMREKRLLPIALMNIADLTPSVMTLNKLGLNTIREYPEQCGRMRGVNMADRPYELYKKACFQSEIRNDNTIQDTYRILGVIRSSKTFQKTQQYSEALLEYLGQENVSDNVSTYVRIYQTFEQLKKADNVIDLSDQIILAAEGLSKYESLRAKLARKYPFIIVDEAQDSNWAQYNLVSLIANTHKNIVMVGDDDQTIYKFQGADPEILHIFQDTFKAKKVLYDKNYRSSPAIVRVSDRLIGRNRNRFEKSVHSMNSDGDFEHPEVILSATNELFSKELVGKIRRDMSNGVELKDMAILYRLNGICDGVAETLDRANIPYKVLGGKKRGSEPEIDSFGYYIRLMLNPFDYPAFQSLGRLYGIKKNDIEAAIKASQRSSEPMIGVVEAAAQKRSQNMRTFSAETTSILRAIHNSDPAEAFSALRKSLTFTQIMMRYRKTNHKGSFELADQEVFLNDYDDRIQHFLNRKAVRDLSDYEKYKILAEDHFSGEDMDMGDANGITLGSMHKSKGMEWDNVHVIGMSEKMLPNFKGSDEPEVKDIESERSIAFVAITRARERLYMYHSDELRVGEHIRKNLEPSRFLADMDYKLS